VWGCWGIGGFDSHDEGKANENFVAVDALLHSAHAIDKKIKER